VAKGLKRRESTKLRNDFFYRKPRRLLHRCTWKRVKCHWGETSDFLRILCAATAERSARSPSLPRVLAILPPCSRSSQIGCSDPPAAPSRERTPPSRKQPPAPPAASSRECRSPSCARPPAHQLSLPSASRPIDSPW
jgi:hypothetical protein